MATPKQFRRRSRWSLIIGVVFAALAFGAVASADQVQGDSDVVTANIQNNPIPVTLAPGGTQNVTAGVEIKSQGSTHVAFPVSITASTENITGTTVGPPANSSLTVSAYGDAGEQTTTFPVTAPAANDPSLLCGQDNLFQAKLHFTATTDLTALTGGNDTDFVIVNLTVPGPACAPTNTAPLVAFDANQPSTATEGDTKTFNFTITDTVGGPFTFAAGYPDCGTGNTLVAGYSITGNTGTFQCTFVDGLVPAVNSAVKVKVADSGPLNSNEASMDVLVSNANPVVAAPAFSSTSIDCKQSTNLTGISFSDAGVADNPWSLDINWGDGSTHYTDTAVGTQGGYASQSHTYNTPGTYTATVGVTDKDTGFGSNTSSNTVTVNQVYTVSFLQPLDGSTPAKVIGNTVKKGRVVPVKAIITDACTGSYVTNPTTDVTIVTADATFVPNATDAVETFSDAGSSSGGTTSFRWTSDPTAPGGGYWIYNLDTSGFSVGTAHNIYVKAGSTKALTNYADVITTK
jgi:PKD domain